MATQIDDDDRTLDLIREHEQEIQRLKLLLTKQANWTKSSSPWPLEQEEYQRYGRQLILAELGIKGQIKLRDAKVLIVGLGGLGCPAAAYLAGAGIGTLGLMDGDTVDCSNLHRQILHSTETVGRLKVESAALNLKRLNPLVQHRLHPYHLEPQKAMADFSQYDLVLDCTDHPMSRYLVSDAAVCAGIPFVSGAALRTDGQLYVLNFPPFRPTATADYVSGPCYRCVHPRPPPADTMISCAEGGILGPVVGTIGVLMATEAIKVLTSSTFSSLRNSSPQADENEHDAIPNRSSGIPESPAPAPSMLMYSAYATPPFRSIKLRGRRLNCLACSPDASLRIISAESLSSGKVDYVAFCGQLSSVQSLAPQERMEPQRLARAREQPSKERTLLLDVRNHTEFEIGSLPDSMHIPLIEVKKRASEVAARVARDDVSSIVTVCRFGNDSQVAAKTLQEEATGWTRSPCIGDLRGGLAAWTKDVDPNFPNY